jgi:hypothetical protein
MLIEDDVTVTFPGKKPRTITVTELEDLVEGYKQVKMRAAGKCCGIDADGEKVRYVYPAEAAILEEVVE